MIGKRHQNPRLGKKSRPSTEPYTSKIIKASALLGDTKTLLNHWDTSLPVRENLERFHEENLLGKGSRSRIEDILRIFRQRYLTDESVTRALVTLVRGRLPGQSLDRLLYFHSARADSLLYDTVTEILTTQKGHGIIDIDVAEIELTLAEWAKQGRTTTEWSEPTIRRVAQGLMSTLRDFGILEGAVNKRIAAVYLPVESFAYIAFYLKQQHVSGSKLVDHPDWKLFFLSHDAVERFLV